MNGLGDRRTRRARLDALCLPRAAPTPATARQARDGWLSTWLARSLRRAGLRWSASTASTVWLGALVGAAVLGWTGGGLGLALVGLSAGAAVPAAALWARRDHADQELSRAMAVALEAMARSVRSGAGLAQAVGEAAEGAPPPLAGDLLALSTAATQGGGFVAAVDRWSAHRPVPSVRLAAAALALAAESGGPPAKPLDGVASSLRERAALQAEIRALSSQARLSALVIALAPIAFAMLAVGIDSSAARFLLATPAGQLCLAAGLGLDAAGGVWMHRITRGAAS